MIEKKFIEKVDVLGKYINLLDKTETLRKSGVVVRVIGNTIYTQGPPDSKVGEVLEIERGDKKSYLQCILVGFDGKLNTLVPLGDVEGIQPKAGVFSSGRSISVMCGPELLGRILNGNGKPIDGKPIILTKEERTATQNPPNPLSRPPIVDVLTTGVRAIDGLLTVGRGQRVGIFSGSGVGKSSLLGMIARYTNADVNVISLVGERGREVNEFLDLDLGKEALGRTVVFVATSDAPRMEQVNCALLATTVAEYFREQGLQVNLLLDSLTRYAQGLRETSVGEPPITKGYGPSVFTKLAKLVERAGTHSSGGSITGFYTVLTEADEEMDDPIADAVRGFIDGHIILSRKLANQSHYPAIDIPASLSRLMIKITDDDHFTSSSMIKELISAYKTNEDLILLGAYVRGADRLIDMAIQKKPQIDEFLRQRIEEPATFEQAKKGIKSITISGVTEEDEF